MNSRGKKRGHRLLSSWRAEIISNVVEVTGNQGQATVKGFVFLALIGRKEMRNNCKCLCLRESGAKGLDLADVGQGLVSSILSYRLRAWTVVFQHVGRNGNRIAYWLAALSRDDRSGLFQFREAPIGVLNLLQQDIMGV
ncbi:hypothetical protein V6N11_019574 [Hibiscus sabdariffa]|uniref:RNase H type-1 domain-containing protein n=1 Tax=Hibiscus sabdariffa TaxID=183260 RepID=A0ABR2NL46_9ROSI